jgi:hypothetical protein
MAPRVNLWNPSSAQNTRVFGWTELLQEWNRTFTPNAYITTVRDNLRLATDLEHSYAFPLTHFTTYLNEEQDGLKWFIYEICATRWMFGRVRVNYLAQLVDMIDNLDSGFPAFVGSPMNTTVRQFLEEQLTAREMEDVQMLPPLSPFPSRTLRPPPRIVRASSVPYAFSEAPASPLRAPRVVREHPAIMIRFMRDGDGQKDDIIRIVRKDDDEFVITFEDCEGGCKNKATGFSRTDVLGYLSNVLRLVEADEDPFNGVQLLIPNMPTVMFSTDSLTSQLRDLVYDSVETTMDNWPLRSVRD